jgi:hypothetical protein
MLWFWKKLTHHQKQCLSLELAYAGIHATKDDVQRIVQIYKYRWRIEEFHMGLKTGCAMEGASWKGMVS